MAGSITQLSLGLGVDPVAFCVRCHRALTNPISIQAHKGAICRGKENKGMASKGKNFSDEYDDSTPLDEALVIRRDERGVVITNVPHLVTHHSPDGFEFGYAGSGPADLALNVCEWYLHHIGYRSDEPGDRNQCFVGTCWNLAWRLHQKFKRAFIEVIPRDTNVRIYFAIIHQWFEEEIAKDKE